MLRQAAKNLRIRTNGYDTSRQFSQGFFHVGIALWRRVAKGAGRALSLKMRTLKFAGALHEGECSGGSACAEGGRWSVGNAATGRSRAWRAWCCVEWNEV